MALASRTLEQLAIGRVFGLGGNHHRIRSMDWFAKTPPSQPRCALQLRRSHSRHHGGDGDFGRADHPLAMGWNYFGRRCAADGDVWVARTENLSGQISQIH